MEKMNLFDRMGFQYGFQYFFFSTYGGYFLEALPFALLVSAIFGIVRFRRDDETPVRRKVAACSFVCYITGLVCLVLFLDVMRIFWYRLFYSMDSGIVIDWFGGSIDLVPDFFNNIRGENIGNFLMYLPFGILYPLSRKSPTWKNSVIAGLLAVIVIEVLQPVFGRAFDMNDIIIDSISIILSTSILFLVKKIRTR